MKMILSIMASLILVSCASAPKKEEMQAAIKEYQLPNEAKKGEASIYFLRPDGIGGMVRFNVHIGEYDTDDNEIGWTRGGQKMSFYLPAGRHKIFSFAENTDEMEIEVKAGEKVFIRQNVHMGFLFARNSLHKMDELEGTYWFMKLSEGEHKKKRIDESNSSWVP